MRRRLLMILLACTILLSLCGTVSAASDKSAFIWPTDSHSLTRGFSNKHFGIDVSVAAGTPVYASRAGTVYQVYNGCNNFSSPGSCKSKGKCSPNVNYNRGTCNDGFGNGVIIKHVDGSYAAYAHLSAGSITVKKGEAVSQGQIIGKSGSSGNSTGPHLHFSLLKASKLEYWPSYHAGNSVDPLTYFDGSGQSGSDTHLAVAAVTTGADTITQTSAILRGSVSSTGAKMTQCGMLLGTTAEGMTLLGKDSINTYGTTCFYSTSKYGRTLTPGTTYYYQAYAVVDGKEYKGNVRSFTTKPCTNHVKGKYLWYNSAHPHYDYYTCAVCGQTFRDTKTNYVSTCEICNPPKTCNHVKGKYLWYAEEHPHYDHYQCAVCGQTFRDTKTNYVSTCEICNPPKPCNHVKGKYLWYNSAHPHYDYYQCAICGEMYRGTTTNIMPTCEICCPINAYGIWLSGLSATNITANSVKLNASCAYTGSRPTSVGVFLGTGPNSLEIKGSDGGINHNKNPFSIWYNLSGLKAGTTYYYRFYAVVDGKMSYSEIKSFTTSAAR